MSNLYFILYLYPCSWEYPNRQGVGCNTISPDDSANFLSFLQELREQPAGQNITLSAAVSLTPFAGADGNPMNDISEFSKVLDYVGGKFPVIRATILLSCILDRGHEL